MSNQDTMKQWVSTQDGLERLTLEEVSIPEPGEGEVLVKIKAVSLNFRDTEVCMGVYGHHKSIDSKGKLVPCSDMCGEIVASKSPQWSTGDRVLSIFNTTHLSGTITEEDMGTGLGLPLDGVLTQYRVFKGESLVKAPTYMTDQEGATLPIAAVTAWMSINGFQEIGRPLRGKEKVVLLQGTGGVSTAGLLIAKALSLTTIITSSSDDKLNKAKEIGADHIINYKSTPKWDEEVTRLTSGKGADVILETGGADTLRKSFDCVRMGGLISAIGYLGGKQDKESADGLHTNVLALKRNVTLKGILNGPRDRFEEMLAMFESEEIHPVIDKVFAFEQAVDALQYLYSGSHFGKVVVQVA